MRTIAVAAVLSLAAAACSTVSVATDWDRDADFSRLVTFAWMDRAKGEPDPFGGDTLVGKRVVAAVERELAADGRRRADGPPDFLVDLHTFTREYVEMWTFPSYGGYGWAGCGYHWGGWGHDRVMFTPVTEGTLVLDFVDPATKDILWRGVARSILDSSSGSPERVDEAVRKLLLEFPPGD
jgi:Domain of unknown function (DUF4136)